MANGDAARPGLLEPGRRGPALIAHAAGNSERLAQAAIAAAADYLEVDLWVHNGRFEARHERAIYPFPIWVEKWYVRWAPRRPFGLADLLRAADGQSRVFLDLKNGGQDMARLIRQSLDAANGGLHLAASAQQWALLRAVQRLSPEVDTFYSIDVASKLDLLLSVADRDSQPRGVSCRHSLLSPALVRRLHERDLLVVAWTVDDPERAALLAEWGVDGITTHRVADVREALGMQV